MSAPNLELKQTDHLALGFMANGAGNALESYLGGATELPEYEAESLRDAAVFLCDVASGADFLASGRTAKGFNASRSLEAFDYAMGPLEALRGMLEDNNVAGFFREMARVVNTAAGGTLQPNEEEKLQKAAAFFRALHGWVMTQINRERPILGSPSARKGIAAY